jgi:hypothetical protein
MGRIGTGVYPLSLYGDIIGGEKELRTRVYRTSVSAGAADR